MSFFNSHVVVSLISLTFALSGATASHTKAAATPLTKEDQAKDSHYMAVQMTAAADKVEKFLSDEVAKRLNDPSSVDGSTKECLIVCEEVYGSAVDALKKGMKSVAAGDFYTANIAVSAFLTDIDTCDDCFSDAAAPEFLRRFDSWAKGVGDDVLERIAKYST
ncbi:hypothetical protein BUALT_Bualt11G0087100 [Buddleja alternifolia]|uniref:Pectinesterase inhibitor domain-containing protein n=1 Tax=Buddleja alternifolia TaxID=168488 RepID=A0AAV6WTX7_9LAMI|nr:hypothetical protein BUALT_Bualt11G0087100 [Buddleja alternifolia]